MTTEAHEVAANLKANLSDILTLDHALAHLDKVGMTLAEVGMQVRANTAEALLERANALRHRADRIASQEVSACMSSLVATLSNAADNCADRELNALAWQATELANPVLDYEGAAREAGWRVSEHDGQIHHEAVETEDNADGLCGYGALEWSQLCADNDIEPHEIEVYEHWAVSTWLAEKLTAKGERVDTDFAGLNVWSRTTTGQAICADAVILAIAADLEASQ